MPPGRDGTYPLKVNAHGQDRFVAGPAQASADATTRDHGNATERQEWRRAVTLTVGTFVEDDD